MPARAARWPYVAPRRRPGQREVEAPPRKRGGERCFAATGSGTLAMAIATGMPLVVALSERM